MPRLLARLEVPRLERASTGKSLGNPMPAPVIYYIRHGETSWNALGRLQGTRDIALNDLGKKQAVHAGHVLGELLERDGRDKAALPYVASPLSRARLTMELLRGAMRLAPENYAL